MMYVPYIALLVAALAAWVPRWLPGAIVALCVGYASASVTGQLSWTAAAAIGSLLAAALAAMRPERAWQVMGHALFLGLAAAFLAHAVPGFANRPVWGPTEVSPGAVPYTMYINLDKPLIGFWILLTCGWLAHTRGAKQALGWGLAVAVAIAVPCLAVAWSVGLIGWAPKWPLQAWVWLINNLLLVAFAEEALFRGYIHGGLASWWRGRRGGPAAALAIGALVFGLAHLGGGWPWMVSATVAGLGYGWAYQRGGLQTAMVAHLGVNVLHFAWFSYPMLAPR